MMPDSHINSNLDAIIVGGGIFGQVIAATLRAQGRSVVVFDAGYPLAGSKPAACLMKPGWYSSMGNKIYTPALELLDDLYGLQSIQFDIRPLKSSGRLAISSVYWVPPQQILQRLPAIKVSVVDVWPGGVRTDTSRIHKAPLVVVATGYWVNQLLPQYEQKAQRGVAFLWPERYQFKPFIHPYAPYKQFVAFNRGDGLWASDGTAILAKNWTEERVEKSYQRARSELKISDKHQVLQGIRPYAKGHKPCLLEKVQQGLWVASGGAKNGTLAAAHCARIIRDRT